jgi:hypothetical protein
VRSAQIRCSRRNVARRSTQPGAEPAAPAFIKTTAYNGPSSVHSERQEALVGVTGSGNGNGGQAGSGAAPGAGQTQPLTRQDYGKFVQFFRQASPYIEGHRARLFVIVIPGEVGGWPQERGAISLAAGCRGPPLTPPGLAGAAAPKLGAWALLGPGVRAPAAGPGGRAAAWRAGAQGAGAAARVEQPCCPLGPPPTSCCRAPGTAGARPAAPRRRCHPRATRFAPHPPAAAAGGA